ncbi:hypothetical protein M7I_7139 [Glarea lozoyensis 74030]|uniref:Uncharacterized protein n=1 Tax=Glarea lozoyensis (strain ATCC 74030 / MF5533) TaxID=1104152 RepID=H0EWH3_GLAL7|nr:hypothetical protein M7I_7139 [Glarea lozoyensis 74030]
MIALVHVKMTIQSEMEPTLTKYSMFVEEDSQLPILVGYIFRVVFSGDKEFEMIPKEYQSSEKGSEIL